MEKDQSVELTSRVWSPFGLHRNVLHIASDIDHVGNRIAEGYIHPSMFWPSIARGEFVRRLRVEKESIEYRRRIERADYAAGWVLRWMEDTQ